MRIRLTRPLTLLVLQACADEAVTAVPETDASIECACPTCDAAAPHETGPAPDCALDTADAALDRPLFASMTLADGGIATGEWVATYNHLFWWNDPEPELTFALFDVYRLTQYPDDDSFVFLHASDVAAIELTEWPLDRPTYRDTLRSTGLTLRNIAVPDVAYVITANDSYHLEEDGYGDFAFDLVLTDDSGRKFLGDGSRNEDYFIWDAEVRSPVVGEVIEVVRDVADNEPGGFQLNAPANGVGISIFGSFYLYLYHFGQDTIPEGIEVGTTVLEGAVLGRVGNSGMSEEPHLHIALFWYDETGPQPRSWGVPIEFQDIGVSSTPTGPFVGHEYLAPSARQWVRSQAEAR